MRSALLRQGEPGLARRAWGGVLDLLFPPCCGICGAGGGFLCADCERELRPAAPPRCSRCWALSPETLCSSCAGSAVALDGARALYTFEGGARTLVHQLKYRSLHALARPMGELLADYLAQNPLPVDLLVPVPLHRRRRRERGFNQAELLCRAMSSRSEIEIDRRALRRLRNTPHQTRVTDRAQRAANVRGAFSCGGDLSGRRVLLVDDVFTSGATLRECAVSLRAAGAASVWALTFVRADERVANSG